MTEKQFKCTNISANGMTGLFWLGKDQISVYDILKILNDLSEENEQLKQKEERLLSEIEDFQELLIKKDTVCHDRVINLIDDKIAFFYGVKGDLINEDSYRLGQISFAIIVLRELKKELKSND